MPRIESIKKPNQRRIRKRRQLHNQSITVVVVLVIVFVVGGLLIRVGLLRMRSSSSRINAASSALDIPNHLWEDIDLWLQATNQNLQLGQMNEEALTEYMQQSCLPYENNIPNALDPALCQIRDSDANRIGILRPPGLFGRILEDYVGQFLDQRLDDDTHFDLVIQAHPGGSDVATFSKILRPVVMPILLEAIDLTLQTTGDDFLTDQVVLDDLFGVLRLLVRWHCRVAQLALHTAVLSVSMHRLMAYPQETDGDLAEFFNLSPVDAKHWHPHMDTYAETVFSRINAATAFLSEIRVRNRSNPRAIEVAIRSAVQEELIGDFCKPFVDESSSSLPISRDISLSSRTVDLVGSFFDGSYTAACERYPKAKMCIVAKSQTEDRDH